MNFDIITQIKIWLVSSLIITLLLEIQNYIKAEIKLFNSKYPLSLRILVIFVFVGSIIAIYYKYIDNSDFILLLTLEGIIFYTYYTNNNIKELRRQTRIDQLNKEMDLLIGTLIQMEFFIKRNDHYYENIGYHYHLRSPPAWFWKEYHEEEYEITEKMDYLLTKVRQYEYLGSDNLRSSIDNFLEVLLKMHGPQWKDIRNAENTLFEEMRKRSEDISQELKEFNRYI